MEVGTVDGVCRKSFCTCKMQNCKHMSMTRRSLPSHSHPMPTKTRSFKNVHEGSLGSLPGPLPQRIRCREDRDLGGPSRWRLYSRHPTSVLPGTLYNRGVDRFLRSAGLPGCKPTDDLHTSSRRRIPPDCDDHLTQPGRRHRSLPATELESRIEGEVVSNRAGRRRGVRVLLLGGDSPGGGCGDSRG
ncbi:hypothetical protein BKA70DRAFT_298341 [Coprinopsis sp. MPI-PUGE-AT-0042]|nr:hypothetical protein BKA70DRAFT_298341 [Coprinopsis sp. MPI-PUGE-AT-0042]